MLDSGSILMEQVRRSGFLPASSVIHLFVGGSELHGAKVGATDDLDIYGVFLDAPELVLGLHPRKHFVWSTATEERRNGPEDVDVTLYSLRRWAALAVKGNATALHFLFAQSTAISSAAWMRVQEQRHLFLSKRAAAQFLGFAGNQFRRIRGEAGRGTHGRRPEYECVHGYDTKAAMHCLRLYFECMELMRDQVITLPRPEKETLIEVREGKWTLEALTELIESLNSECLQSVASSTLPDEPNEPEIARVLADAHLSFWRERGAM